MSRYRGYALCPECKGARLRKEALYVQVGEKNLAEVVRMNIAEAHGVLQPPGTHSGRDRHCRQDPDRDPSASQVPGRCGSGVPDARPPVGHPFGRRGAAHPACHVPRLAPGRGLLCARRTVHRSAYPRYRSADPHPGRAARHRQHHHSGGARSGSDARRRPHRGSRARRRRARRPDRVRRAARPPHCCRQRLAHRALSARRSAGFGAPLAPRRQSAPPAAILRRPHAQSEEHRCGRSRWA